MYMYNGFTQIENKFISDINLTDGEFRTYLVLRSFWYRNNKDLGVYPSQIRVAKARGKDKRSIVMHIKALIQKRYITKTRRGFNSTNFYEFIGVDNDTCEVKETSLMTTKKLHPNNREFNNTNTNKSGDRSQLIEEIRQKYPFLRKNY